MTTKFNKEMYAKIKGKKNKLLSSIGQRRLRITNKEKYNLNIVYKNITSIFFLKKCVFYLAKPPHLNGKNIFHLTSHLVVKLILKILCTNLPADFQNYLIS